MFRGYLLTALGVVLSSSATAQGNLESIRRELLREGVALYEAERASWVATDLLPTTGVASHFVTATLSYTVADSVRTLLVGGPTAASRVLAEFRFGRHHISPKGARRRGGRALSEHELRLLSFRRQAEHDAQPLLAGTVPAPGTSLNAVVLEWAGEVRVYVLTGTTLSGLTPLGGDLLLRYSPKAGC
ncbi:hypothetical protein LJY25_07725 [Hymenobacter sp. BT175]|uniref:hypothetical protein n=1 Tax=Hymenobacter translucens TaxID=2886507 RepID=UPI001D0DD16E|nr:hypothetical protein [Hymenobacter translucens]MCC2546329.1 hypothetical protein [Hymenobacter translucens]